MRRRWIMLMALLALLALLGACAASREKERLVSLRERVLDYASAVRWGHYGAARGFLRGPQQSASAAPEGDGGFKEVRVTGYEITDWVVSADKLSAQVAVAFTFYPRDSGVIDAVLDRQSWWYDEAAEQWMLDGALPRFAN